MNKIANLLFEANILNKLNRSGYAFLGSGEESVAEHSFMVVFICFVMSRIETDVNCEKMMSMALVHDLPEARTGDFNYVQKKYSMVSEEKAVTDLINGLPFGGDIKALIDEFNAKETREAMLVNDADQLSFILQLKQQKDIGVKGPEKWLPKILKRLKTSTGEKIAESILSTGWDQWWLNDYSE